MTQGAKRKYGCLDQHRRNPAGGYKIHHCEITGTAHYATRRRKVNLAFL